MLLFQTHLCYRALHKYCLTFLFIICCLTCQRVWFNHMLQSKGVFQQVWTWFLVSTFIEPSKSSPYTFLRTTGAACVHQCHFICKAKQNLHSKGDSNLQKKLSAHCTSALLLTPLSPFFSPNTIPSASPCWRSQKQQLCYPSAHDAVALTICYQHLCSA